MVAYQGDVRFEHKGGGIGRMLKKAASGEDLRLMKCTGSGELFLANQAMLVHVLRLEDEELTVNGESILAFENQIEWDVTRVKGGAAGMLAGGLFNIVLRGRGLVALTSDGQPIKLDAGEAPTFADPRSRGPAASRRLGTTSSGARPTKASTTPSSPHASTRRSRSPRGAKTAPLIPRQGARGGAPAPWRAGSREDQDPAPPDSRASVRRISSEVVRSRPPAKRRRLA
jgi:hypothetical protein